VPADRPGNIYVVGTKKIEAHAHIFQCPGDRGCSLAATGARPWDSWSADNASGENGQSCYGAIGSSYEINTWLYCKPGALTGFGINPPSQRPATYRSDLRPDQIVGSASHFVVLGDIGCMSAGRHSPEIQRVRNIFTGWWHGRDWGQLAFLDGSARRVKMGALSTSSYTFFVDATRHTLASWSRPETP
jgi:hypothetical protein